MAERDRRDEGLWMINDFRGKGQWRGQISRLLGARNCGISEIRLFFEKEVGFLEQF